MSKILSNEQCQKVLQSRFQTQDIKLVDYELKPISENAEGYMGEHYYLTITYKLNGKTSKDVLFMKRKPTNKTQAELATESRLYEKEILFYDVLLPKFESKGYNVNFAGKSYYCITDEAIIMENLINNGYEILERNQTFDMAKIKCCLKSLALYHGAGFAYEKSKSEEMGKTYRLTDDYSEILVERFFCQYLETNDVALKFWDGCNNTIANLIKVLPKDEKYRKEFLELFLNYPISKVFAEETKLVKTCGHGDLWSNNMMFKFDGNTPVDCRLVDFQLVRYFFPAFDVLLSVYGNTDADFRKKHLQELYEYYYNTLAEIIQNYGYDINDIMTKDDFYETIRLVKPECLLQVAFTDTIISIPKEELNTTLKSDDNSFEELIFNNSDITVKSFKENEKFKKRMSELLYDIHDAMVAKKENI